MNCKDKMCGALDCDTCHPENRSMPVGRFLACANEIAEQYTHTRFNEGVSEIIEQHFQEDVEDAERFRIALKEISHIDDDVYRGEDDGPELFRRLCAAVLLAENALKTDRSSAMPNEKS